MTYKIGDKVRVKEKFWEKGISGAPDITSGMKELANEVLEVSYVTGYGSVETKTGTHGDDIEISYLWHPSWLEPVTRTIEDVAEGDLIVSNVGYRRVLGRAGKAVFMSCSWEKGGTETSEAFRPVQSIQDLKDDGYTIVSEDPNPDLIEIDGKTYDRAAVNERLSELPTVE